MRLRVTILVALLLGTTITAMTVSAVAPRPGAVDRIRVRSVPDGDGPDVERQEVDAGPERLPFPDTGEHAVAGSHRCRVCHRAIWEAWRAGPHADAGTSLDGADLEVDETCDRCHNPVFEVETGVGCEGCHGPGGDYLEIPVMIDPVKHRQAGLWPARETCDRCHNPGHPFHVERDLETAVPTVHPGPPIRVIR